MYNFVLNEFSEATSKIEIVLSGHHPQFLQKALWDLDEKKYVADYLAQPAKVFERLEFTSAFELLETLIGDLQLGIPIGHKEVRVTLNSVLDLVRTASRKAWFYYYPRDAVKKLKSFDSDWALVIRKFPSAEKELRTGVDLWALGHGTASVHHMMRGVEVGLRVLAKERKVTFANKPTDWGTWGDLLTALDAKVLEIKKTAANGPKKDAALKFYGPALSHMRSLNHTRDLVAHVREDFDEHQALSTINHVHEIMTVLASKLSEASSRSISWGL